MSASNAYTVLGLTPDADDTVVKAAYRALSKKHHPDQGGDPDEFKQINAAYEAIINNTKYTDPTGTTTNTGMHGGGGLFGGFFSSDPIETKSTTGTPDYGITVSGDYFSATIVGIHHHGDIRDLVFEHQLDERPGHHRTVILYDLENTSDQVITWHADNSKYIGSDSYTYDRSEYLVEDSRIRPPWTGFYVDIEGGTRSRFIEIVERMPEDTTLSKVVHTLSIHAPGRTSGWVEDQERFEFVIDDSDLPALEQPPS